MKRVIITFDYEGRWGMPHHNGTYDLTATTHRLLELLERYHAKAVFFAVGQLAEAHPELIRTIHEQGHEIGLHGYTHEHMHQLTPSQLQQLMAQLQGASQHVQDLTGQRPTGFRAPYLMGPKFYDPTIYNALAATGFSWISNREIRTPEELFRPDRLRWGQATLRLTPIRQALLLALNPALFRQEHLAPSHRHRAARRWLLGAQSPFQRPEGLTEYPLHAPLDCDLLGLPRPTDVSSTKLIDYAADTVIRAYERSRGHFTINCHDWIIGTSNRLEVLERILAYISSRPDTHFYLPGRSELPS